MATFEAGIDVVKGLVGLAEKGGPVGKIKGNTDDIYFEKGVETQRKTQTHCA